MAMKRSLTLPLLVGLVAVFLLAGLYLGIVSWAESTRHAINLFWQDRWIVLPIILGFGIQSGLYTVLRFQLFLPQADNAPTGTLLAASGTTSSAAMVACCAHHVTDVLPILGFTAAATFLAEYRLTFMYVGLGMTVIGILLMLYLLAREKKRYTKPDYQSSAQMEIS